jgi:hypothetical protein
LLGLGGLLITLLGLGGLLITLLGLGGLLITLLGVISQATKEVQSTVERRNNILVFNVPESESNMKD